MGGLCFTNEFWKFAFVVSLFILSFSANNVGMAFKWNNEITLLWANGCDFPGNDLKNVQIPAERCGPACEMDDYCSHFAWTKYKGGTCWLKTCGAKAKDAVSNTPFAETVCGFLLDN